MDPRSHRTILLGAGVVVFVTLAILVTIGYDNIYVWLVGIPGGLAVGLAAHEYAPVIRDGLYAGGLGVTVLATLVTVEGFYRSVTLDWGLDSWLSFSGAAKGLLGLIVIGPGIVIQCLVVAAVVHEIRLRRGTWANGKAE